MTRINAQRSRSMLSTPDDVTKSIDPSGILDCRALLTANRAPTGPCRDGRDREGDIRTIQSGSLHLTPCGGTHSKPKPCSMPAPASHRTTSWTSDPVDDDG